MATAGQPNDRVTARAPGRRAAVGRHGIPHRVPLARRPRARASRSAPRSRPSGPRCCRRCWGSTRPRSPASAWSSTTPTRTAWRCSTSRTCARSSRYLTSDEGKADLKALGGLSSATAGVILRELIAFSDQGADAFFGEPEFDTSDLLRTAADGKGLVTCLELPAVQDRPALFSTFLMWMLADLFHDLPEVGDARQAQAGLLLRRGAPAVRRREQGVPGRDRADRAAHPLQGRRRLLRDPEPEGRARRRAGPARQPGAARPARLHPRRRQGAQGRGVDLPHTATTTSSSCSPRSAPARPSSPSSPRAGRRPPWRGPG